jgi:hypothetical protein
MHAYCLMLLQPQERNKLIRHISEQPERAWTSNAWSFRNDAKVYGSPMFDALWAEAMDGICRYTPLEHLADTLRAVPLPSYEGEVLGGPGVVQRARSAWRSGGIGGRGRGGNSEGGDEGHDRPMDPDNPEDVAAAAAAAAARAAARAAAAARKRAKEGPPPPTELLPLPENVPEQLEVVCNGTRGTLLLRAQRVLVGGQELAASRYEDMCGRGGAKKWKSSVWAADADGNGECCMGDWLNARGLDKHELAKLAANYAAVEQRRLWEQEHPEEAAVQQQQQQHDQGDDAGGAAADTAPAGAREAAAGTAAAGMGAAASNADAAADAAAVSAHSSLEPGRNSVPGADDMDIDAAAL